MEITEVRVALREVSGRPGETDGRPGDRRLKAYATLTFDNCFVVRNIKIIEGRNGLFVAMPSRKPKLACSRCGFKGELGHRYCTQCGTPMPRVEPRPAGSSADAEGEAQAHRDIAHPITAEFRQYLQQKILEAYEAERTKGQTAMSVRVDEEAV